MKRLMVLVVGLVFLFVSSVIAADTKAPADAKAPAKAEAAKAEPAKADAAKAEKKAEKKVADKKASGKVLEVSDKALKIERTVKGKAETVEFVLDKALADIKAGDQVNVSYSVKDGKNVVTKAAVAAAKKKAEKAEKKAEPAKADKKAEPAKTDAPKAAEKK
jgi:colicin import membrane protein